MQSIETLKTVQYD